MPPRTASLSAIAVCSRQACSRRDGTSTRSGLRAWLLATGRAIALIATGVASLAPAQAQITFRNASSAAALAAPSNPVASSGTTNTVNFATITFVDDAREPATDGANVTAASTTITPPGGMAAGDFVIVYVAARTTGVTITNSATGGQTWTLGTDSEANGISFRIFHSLFNGTWTADPSFSWTNTASYQVWMLVFRGVDTTTPIVAGPSIAAFSNASVNVTIGAGTISTGTVTNAMVIASWHSQDDNTWALQTPGWSNPNGQAQQRKSGGPGATHSSSSIGYKVQAAGGGNEAVTNQQTGNGPDAGIRSILALRPARVLSITKPTGTAAGDVLVASIGFRPSCCDTPLANYTISPQDAGWTQLRKLDNAPAAGTLPSNSLAVYWKVAGASEPAAYRWSFPVFGGATFDGAAGGILKFSGAEVEAVAPIIGVEENGQLTSFGTSHATPSIATPAVNSMLVASYGISNAGPDHWTMADTSVLWTEPFDVTGGSEAVAMYYAVKPVVGATGPITANSAVADIGNAHILALRSATSGTALTIPIPQGTVSGDVMIAAIAVRPSATEITTLPSGWVEVRPPEVQTAGTPSAQVFYIKAAGPSEPASYTWTLAATNTGAVGGIQSFSGVDTTAPVEVNAIDNKGGNLSPGTGGAITATGINANVAGTVAVSAHSFSSSANWTPPADAVAEDVDVASRRVPNAVGISLAMYHYPTQDVPGPTGDKTATASNDVDTGIGQILTLKPAPPPAPAVGGFNAYETSTAPGAITGVIKTKIAGSTASVDMIALNAAKTAIATGFTGTVRVEVLNASDNSGALDANGCRPTWTVIQTLSPDPAFIAGDNGRKTISFTQANSFPNARLRITYPAGAPTVTGCSNDNFAIRPNAFASFTVTDTDWQTAGLGRTLNDVTFILPPPGGAGKIHNAGRPLSVRATAVNAAAATTTNYVGTPTAMLSACVGAACTATFGTMSLGASFVAGQLASDVASYDNVGSFQLELVDSSFASVDATDSSALEREIRSGTINVGRFVPDHFAVALNTPAFGSACGASFTYVGQAFNYTTAPVIIVTARDFANNTTTLYEDNWWRITNATLTGKSYTAATGTLDVSGLPGTDPTVFAAGAGTGTLTFSSGTGIFFDRTTPVAPFDADISLAINVIDTDGVTSASPASFGAATAGNGIAFDNAKEMRFGQLATSNAYGSQLVPLQLRMEVQYWNGTAFVTNTDDDCTSLAATNFEMRDFTQNLAACETSLTVGAFSNGRATAQLSGPGSSNTGGVFLIPRLDSSVSGAPQTCIAGTLQPVVGANRPYLQSKWDSTDEDSDGLMFDDDPESQATFGTYRGAEEVIFIRENF